MSDHLTAVLPDGSRFALDTPQRPVPGAAYWPAFATGAAGTYTSPGGSFAFTLTGAGDWWDTMTFTSEAGYGGSFTFDGNFVGGGHLRENGQPAGALQWTEDGTGLLNLLQIGSEEVTPSAAARDLRLDAWIGAVAFMGPAPIY